MEKFLSMILPGSGTVYRSEHRGSDATPSDRTSESVGKTPSTVVRQTANRTPLSTLATAAYRSPVVTPVESALHEAPSLRKTKRRVCKMIPMVSRDGVLRMKRVCYHVSNVTMLPATPPVVQTR